MSKDLQPGHAPSTRRDHLPDWIAGLALNVGKEDFDSHLMHALSEIVGAEDCAAFHYGADGVRTIAVGSIRNLHNTRLAARRYETKFWKRDRDLLAHRIAAQPSGPVIYEMTADKIGDRQFRRSCYDFQDVTMQTSIRIRSRSGVHSLSAFWGRSQKSHGLPLDRLSAAASTLMAFVIRHTEISSPRIQRTTRALSLAGAEVMVRELEASLTEREVAVCARILRGLTMQGIAIDLGLSVHSVVTYKRRAFSRLHIGTTAELFALCMPTQDERHSHA